MKVFDISLPMHPAMAVWPGDTPYDFQLVCRLRDGATVNLGSATMSVHTGSHADAPFHFHSEGASIDEVPLSVYIGPALVVDLVGRVRITCDDLRALDLSGTPRILFKTGGWTDHTRFPETIPLMDSDVPAYLQEHGVILVGLDVPSVDAIESKDLPNHHALAACGIHILEALDLDRVSAGRYELVALPLRMVGADGSPIRAVLLQ